MTLHAYQQYDAAARAYSRAHLLDPRNFDWLYLFGAVQMELGAFDAAVKLFQSALRLRPDDLPANLRLAQSLAALPSWEEAGALYRRILDRHADCAQAWYGLARVQAARGDHAGAAQSYTKAIDLFPAYGVAHFALAAELRRLGKPAEGGQHFAIYEKNVTAEPPLADPLFRRIHELNHGAQAHIQRGTELEKEGRLDEAIREHETALAIDAANVQVHVNLISLYGRTGDSWPPSWIRAVQTLGTTTVSCCFTSKISAKRNRHFSTPCRSTLAMRKRTTISAPFMSNRASSTRQQTSSARPSQRSRTIRWRGFT